MKNSVKIITISSVHIKKNINLGKFLRLVNISLAQANEF